MIGLFWQVFELLQAGHVRVDGMSVTLPHHNMDAGVVVKRSGRYVVSHIFLLKCMDVNTFMSQKN